MSIPQDLLATTEADILSLIADEAAESTYLEFKRDLPGQDSSAKHEFSADVSAMANIAGGDIVYGMEEVEGKAGAVFPMTGDADLAIRRLQDILMHGVEPRIPGVAVYAVPVTGGFVVLVRVPQSWAGPHRVKGNQHFFLRENGRKRQLDVPEIRNLFLRSAEQGQRIRDFRTERLGRILAGEAPAPLTHGPQMVLHLVPQDASLGLMNVDPVAYLSRNLPMIGGASGSRRINIDGALLVRNSSVSAAAYSQFFRNGFFETVKSIFHPRTGQAILRGHAYEQDTIDVLTKFREELKQLGASGDLTAMLSLTEANKLDFAIRREALMLDDHEGKFDRSMVIIPDVLIPAGELADTALRPLFDMVWQASGLTESANYGPDGRFQRRD